MTASKYRLGVAALALVFVGLMALPACDPVPMNIPVVRSVTVQPDQSTLTVQWPQVEAVVNSYEIWYRAAGTSTWLWSSGSSVGSTHGSFVPYVAGATEYQQDFRATGITPGNAYEISVRTVSTAGGCPCSDREDARSKVALTTRVPQSVTTTSTANSITMAWSSYSSTPWNSWNFYRSTGSTSTPAYDSSSNDQSLTTKTFTGLATNTTHTLGLVAVQDNGDGTNHRVLSALTATVATTGDDWVENTAASDEFNESTLDTDKWNVVNSGIGNYYSCMRANNVVVGDGTLKLMTRSETAVCNGGQTLPYTGSYIQTRYAPDNVNQAYGKFEFRAKMPAGKGLWPAIWLTNVSGASHGELDVIEQPGVDPTWWASTIHYYPAGSPHLKSSKSHKTTPVVDLSAGFHTYTLEWTPCRILILLDGQVQADWTSWFNTTPAPFDRNGPMHIRLDNKIGRRDTNPPNGLLPAMLDTNLADPSNPLPPTAFEIDWMRVYAKASYPLPAGCPGL